MANLAINENEARDLYTSTGESVFTYTFPVKTTDDLMVSVNRVDLVYGTDYTFSGLGDAAGGDVTITAGTTSGDDVAIWLDLPIKRETGFTEGAVVLTAQALNDEFAERTRVDQMLRGETRRALRLEPDDPTSGNSMVLGPNDATAFQYIGRDVGGGIGYATEAISTVVPLTSDLVGQYIHPQTTEELGLGITPTDYTYPPGHVHRYGAEPNVAASQHAEFQTAIDYIASLPEGGEVLIGAGKYKFTTKLNIKSYVLLRGTGRGTHLEFDSCALKASGLDEDVWVRYWGIQDIQISRIGTVGPAFITEGNNTGKDCIRFNISNLTISSSTGNGWDCDSTYLGTITNLFVTLCEIGVRIWWEAGKTSSGNALTFVGGEFQNNNHGCSIMQCVGVMFYGTAIEGNYLTGLDLFDNCRHVGFHGGYFETNGGTDPANGFDVRIGLTGGTKKGYTFDNVYFTDGSAAKDHAIILENCEEVSIRGCTFSGYVEAIANDDGGGSDNVTGLVTNCGTDTLPLIGGTEGVNNKFNRGIKESQLYFEKGSVDIANLVTGTSSAIQTIAATGVVAGDFVEVSTATSLQGMSLTAYTATDNIRFILTNNTGGDIDLGSTTYRAIVTPKALYTT